LILTASLTLFALSASVILTLTGQGAPVAVLHLAFAIGVAPLIVAAMLHFVPVLTRTGDPPRGLRRLPMAAQIAGLLAVAAMQGVLPYWTLHLAALLDLLLALALLSWIIRRAHAAIGRPHPGWRWYALALACLIAALAVVPLWTAWPPLRSLHLHLNTLGLVGLAALGTLPVLLPTACARPDPGAGLWLGRKLWMTVACVLLIASGSAWHWTLSATGSGLLLVVLLSLLRQWGRAFGVRTLLADGVACSLLTAVGGLMLTLAAGLAHGFGLLPARLTLLVWLFGFLLPLISGALSQLLPVWRWPGRQTPARLEMRRRLAKTGGWRALLFFVAAVLALAAIELAAIACAAAGLLMFGVALLDALRVRQAAQH
jgi:hypothetical protein